MTSAADVTPAGPVRVGDLAILFLTHKWSRPIALRFARLWREMAGYTDCFLLLQDDGGEVRQRWARFLKKLGATGAMILFKADGLESALGYKSNSSRGLLPGSVHFPLLAVGRATHYRHYWLVEYDVEYRGKWSEFFGAFGHCDADLLAAHLQSFEDNPGWGWWKGFHPPPDARIGREKFRKVFMPLYRVSSAALACTDAAHRAGWRGHVEALMPTVLGLNGLSIQDLNAIIPCYLGDCQEPCNDTHAQSSFRWRPAVSYYEFVHRGQTPLLFHPVKEW